MRCGAIVALALGIVLMLLVVLARRFYRRGKRIPTAAKAPRATRQPKPFTGFTRKPECLVWQQEAGL